MTASDAGLNSAALRSGAPSGQAPQTQRDRRDALIRLLGFGVLFAIFGGVLAVSFGVTHQAIQSGAVQLSPPCTAKELFGACPTCGLTRAFAALSHGDVAAAQRYHGASPWVYGAWWLVTVALFVSTLRAAWDYVARRRVIPS